MNLWVLNAEVSPKIIINSAENKPKYLYPSGFRKALLPENSLVSTRKKNTSRT